MATYPRPPPSSNRLPFAFCGAVSLIESGPKPPRQFRRIVVRPEVHIVEGWLLVEQVLVQRQCLDAVLAQGLDYGVDLVLCHCKVPVYRCFTSPCRLEHQQRATLHLGRERCTGSCINDRLGTRNAEMVCAAFSLTFLAYYLVELVGVEV